MKLVIQTVLKAACHVDNQLISAIDRGYMILVGIGLEDDEAKVKKLAEKVSKLRVFEDEDGKMNLDIHAIKGAILSVSQFTLYGDTAKGNRPSFTKALSGEKAEALYEYFNECLRQEGIEVSKGVFGAHMEISLVNDGPKTFIMEV